MKPQFITYKTLPDDLKAIRDKAFSHSVFTPECQAMDDLGEYTALYMNGKFIGAVNTIKNQKPIELWSQNKVIINEPYAFFCRGFIGEDVRFGLGSHILVLLTTHLMLTNKRGYVCVRDQYNGIMNELFKGSNKFTSKFNSFHDITKEVELNLIEYTNEIQKLNDRKTELISYLQQKLS